MKEFANRESVTLAAFSLVDDIPLPRFTISLSRGAVISLKERVFRIFGERLLPYLWLRDAAGI